ncbi:MAG: ribonuclease HII [Anaerolineae bacterium]
MVPVQQPDLCREHALYTQGHKLIAGIDEAGRGAWAGPVVAAVCVLPLYDPNLATTLALVRDSKLLSARQRDACYRLITGCAVGWGIGSAEVEEIDSLGILPATRLAMERAVAALNVQPDLLMIDAVKLPRIAITQIVENKADLHYLSVASASILAKVTRDRYMVNLEHTWPGYGFNRHKGYGTPKHQAALRELGVCEVHRHSYRPIRELLEPACTAEE